MKKIFIAALAFALPFGLMAQDASNEKTEKIEKRKGLRKKKKRRGRKLS